MRTISFRITLLWMAGVISTIISLSCNAQVSINETGAAPHPSSALDIDYPGKGLLVPRMAQEVIDTMTNVPFGLMVLNTSTECLNMWTGSTWKQSCFDCAFSPPVAGSAGLACEGNTVPLYSSTVPGATYQWTGPDGFSSTLQNPILSSVTLAQGGLYSVTATVNGCTSQASSILVSVTPAPPSPVPSQNGPLCPGDQIELDALSIPGATYSWSGPSDFSSTEEDPVIESITTLNGGTYGVTATVNGCTSFGSVAVTVHPTPVTPVAGNDGPVCSGLPVALSASAITDASYSWTGPSGFTSSEQNPTITNASGSSAGEYFVTAEVNGCPSLAGSTNVEVIGGAGYRYFRLTVSGSTSPFQAQVAELQFHNGTSWVTNDMTSMNTPSPKVVSASNGLDGFYSSAPPWQIFDGLGPTSHYTVGELNTNSNWPYWISIDFGPCNSFTPTQYSISTSSYSDSGGTYRPTAWTLEGSNDNMNWSLLDSRSGVSFSGGETKTYSL